VSVPSLVDFVGGIIPASTVNQWITAIRYCLRPPAAQVVSTVAQSIANNTGTALVWNTETFDSKFMVDLAGNPTRITFSDTGLYVVGASFGFAINATNQRQGFLRINGDTNLRVATSTIDAAANSIQTDFSLAGSWLAAPGDYVECMAFQNSGGALSTLALPQQPRMVAVRVSGL